MESNRNHNTAAIYAAKYTASTRVAQSLFPWAPQPPTGARPWREGITDGYAQLLPNVTAPTSVQGSNIKPGETPNSIHGTIVKSLALPTSGKLYHVVIGPNQDAFMR